MSRAKAVPITPSRVVVDTGKVRRVPHHDFFLLSELGQAAVRVLLHHLRVVAEEDRVEEPAVLHQLAALGGLQNSDKGFEFIAKQTPSL